MRRNLRREASNLILAFLVSVSFSTPATADTSRIYPKKHRALLEYSLLIEGQVDHKGTIGDFTRWSSKRTFEGKVEVEAKNPAIQSFTSLPQAQAAATRAVPGNMQEFQKQMQACGGDTQCQMALSMQMMNSPQAQAQMQAADQAAAAPKRYQAWQPAKGGRVEVKASIRENTDGLFITAQKERTVCSYQGDYDASAFGGVLGGSVEVDTRTGTSAFIGLPMAYVQIKKHCTRDFGSNRETNETAMVAFLPNLKSPGPVTGGGLTGSGKEIAKGQATLTGTLPNTAGAQGPATVNITLQWKLTEL